MNINSPSDFEEIYFEGTRLLHAGKVEEALMLLEQAIELRPGHADAALNLSGAYILTKRFRQAANLLEPVSQEYPENAMVWINLGAAYLGNPILASEDEQLKAIRSFKQALEINPTAPSVAYNIGLIYRDRKEFDEAKYWFREAIQANPRDVHAREILNRLEAMEDNSSDS